MTIIYILVKNKLLFNTRALIDLGANGFALIDQLFLIRLSYFLKLFTAKLHKPL
jgi:hypothetical protein